MDNYLDINREGWNQRTDAHWGSEFYNVEAWLKGNNDNLREIERALLPDLAGKRLLHLFCHFGQDTLSLARLGAEVTGVDLSDRAIERARELSELAKVPGRFINSDVLSLRNKLDEAASYDVVFQTYGTLGWLPELGEWGKTVAHYLKPGGRLVLADFHPVLWMLDDKQRDKVGYPYFNLEPIVESSTDSYTDGSDQLKFTEVSWNHSMSDILSSLLDAGLRIESFKEFDYSPWECFQDCVPADAPFRWYLKGMERQLPLVYAIQACK